MQLQCSSMRARVKLSHSHLASKYSSCHFTTAFDLRLRNGYTSWSFSFLCASSRIFSFHSKHPPQLGLTFNQEGFANFPAIGQLAFVPNQHIYSAGYGIFDGNHSVGCEKQKLLIVFISHFF
jgi:hypothetical protein